MIRPLLKGLGVGLLILGLAGVSALSWPRLLQGMSVGPSIPSVAAGEPEPARGTEYEPLRPGTRLTYRDALGLEFTREVMLPVNVEWFDESVREVIPLYDSRYDVYFFLRNQGGEIQAIGAWDGVDLERWGEYMILLSANAPQAEPVQTAAGHFTDVRLMQDEFGNSFYARGVGLVRAASYELIHYEVGDPKVSPVPGIGADHAE